MYKNLNTANYIEHVYWEQVHKGTSSWPCVLVCSKIFRVNFKILKFPGIKWVQQFLFFWLAAIVTAKIISTLTQSGKFYLFNTEYPFHQLDQVSSQTD